MPKVRLSFFEGRKFEAFAHAEAEDSMNRGFVQIRASGIDPWLEKINFHFEEEPSERSRPLLNS